MYMTINELGAYLGVSRWTVMRLLDDGELVAGNDRAKGVTVAIERSSVANYLRRHTVTHTQEPTAMPLPNTTIELPVLISLEDVAGRTGMSLRVLQDGCRAKPPRWAHVHIGRNRYMTPEQVTELVRDQTAGKGDPDDDLADVRARVGRTQARKSAPKPQRGAA